MIRVPVQVMRKILTDAKALFKSNGGDPSDPFLGDEVDVSAIGMKWFRHFKADGAAAAQLWARKMAAKKISELRDFFTKEQLEKLTPVERALLFWFIVTNCTMHNLNLGAKHAAKAAAKLTETLAKPAVQAMKDAGMWFHLYSYHC